jgi:hypothetical protein
MLTLLEQISDDVIAIKAHGRMTDADYEMVVPALKSVVHPPDRVSVLFDLPDYQIEELETALADVKFGLQRRGDFSCCTIVCGKDVIPAHLCEHAR